MFRSEAIVYVFPMVTPVGTPVTVNATAPRKLFSRVIQKSTLEPNNAFTVADTLAGMRSENDGRGIVIDRLVTDAVAWVPVTRTANVKVPGVARLSCDRRMWMFESRQREVRTDLAHRKCRRWVE